MSMSEVRAAGRVLFTAIIRDITDQLRMEERIRQLAHYDELTGLPNRALFHDRLKQALLLAQRGEHRVGLLYVDLDGFKPVNDNYGHHVGDAVLKATAERLRQAVRASDTVARMGGDEFTAILAPIDGTSDAERLALRVGQAFETPIAVDDVMLRVGASVGFAVYPDHGSSIEDLLQVADGHMYRAKSERAVA